MFGVDWSGVDYRVFRGLFFGFAIDTPPFWAFMLCQESKKYELDMNEL